MPGPPSLGGSILGLLPTLALAVAGCTSSDDGSIDLFASKDGPRPAPDSCGQCDDRAPYCQDRRCVECLEDSHCDEREPHCDTTRGECVDCLRDADCSERDPYCELLRGECVDCLVDAHCRDGQRCRDHRCGE